MLAMLLQTIKILRLYKYMYTNIFYFSHFLMITLICVNGIIIIHMIYPYITIFFIFLCVLFVFLLSWSLCNWPLGC
jgi:hypothetical protein